ncbi:Cytochrome b561 and DOMON domain-containing protein [Hirschfeldia incana]|nr:Cytochrome b561 and DOMON domain-containing protein [Hirschfeldia incana]
MGMNLYSSVSFILFTVIGLQCLPLTIQQTTETCSSTLPLNDLTFNSSLLQCVEAWTPQNYILRYARTVENTWSFILSAPDSSVFVGIGFSTDGHMIGSSAVVGWLPPNGGRGEAKQYFLGGQSPSQVMPDQGDLVIVNGSLKIESMSSRLYMSFQLTVEMPRKSILYAKGPAGFFPSSPGFRLREHQSMTTTTINYVTGSQRVVKGSSHSMLRKIHGLMNMFGWGIQIIIGAIVARHMRQTTAYFYGYLLYYSHIAIQTTGFLLGLIGIICGLFLENQTNANNVSTHKALGITILVMGVLQVLALLGQPDKESKYRKYWNWYHHNIGRVMIILTIFNIFYGIHLGKAGTSWSVGYGSAVGVLALVAIVLEVRNFLNNITRF